LNQLEASRAEHDRLSTQVSLLEAQLRGAQQSQSLLEIDLASKNRVIDELKQQINKSGGAGSPKEFAALLEQREQYASWLEGAKSMIEKMRTQIDGLQAQNKALLDEAKFNQQQADEVPKLKAELAEVKKNNRHLKDRLETLSDGSPRSGRRGSEPVKPQSLSQRLEPLIRAVGISVANDVTLLQQAVADAQKFEETLKNSESSPTPLKLSTILLDCTTDSPLPAYPLSHHHFAPDVKSQLLNTNVVDDASLLPLTLIISQKLIQLSALLEKANSELKFLQESEKETREDLNKKSAAKIQHHVTMYNTLAKEMEALNQELQEARAKLDQSSGDETLSGRISELEKLLAQAEADKLSLNDQLEKSSSAHSTVVEELSKLKSQHSELSLQLSDSEKARMDLSSQLEAAKNASNAELEVAAQEKLTFSKQLQDQVAQLNELQSTRSKDSARFAELEAELQQVKDKNASIGKEQEDMLALNSALTGQLRDAHAKTAELEALLGKERQQMLQLQANFASAVSSDSDEKSKLAADLAEAHATQRVHEAQISDLKEQLKHLSSYTDSSVAELKKKLANREAELDELQMVKTALDDGNRVLKEQLTQYMEDADKMKDQLVLAQDKYDKLLASVDDISGKLRDEIVIHEKEVARMRELLDHKDEQNESQGKLIDNLNRQIHEMADLDAARDQQMKMLNQELAKTRTDLSDLQNRFASELGLLTNRETQITTQVSSLETQLESSSRKLAEEQSRAAVAEEARVITHSPGSLLARSAVWRNQTAISGSLPDPSVAAMPISIHPSSSSSSAVVPSSSPELEGTDSQQLPPSILSSSWWSQIFT
jgi:chromosome segregation ATPase